MLSFCITLFPRKQTGKDLQMGICEREGFWVVLLLLKPFVLCFLKFQNSNSNQMSKWKITHNLTVSLEVRTNPSFGSIKAGRICYEYGPDIDVE